MAAQFDKYKKDINRSTFVRYNENYLKDNFGTTDISPFWVADSDFIVMPELIKALKKTAKRGLYPYELKTLAIKQPLIDWFKKRHNVEIKMDGLLFTTSVNTGLAAAIDELTTKGDGIIIQPPVFQGFKGIINGVGRKIINNPLKLTNGRYEIDFTDLEKKASDKKNTAIILCSPHNPVGRVWKVKELEKIAGICIANNVLMLTDEIHADVIYSSNTFVGMTEVYKGKSDNIIMFGSAGKSFGIPGLVDSFMYTPNSTLKKAMQERIMRFHLGKSNAFGNAALKTVYKYGHKWLDTKTAYLAKTVNTIDEYLKKNIPNISLVKPEGTYQVWLDFNKVVKNDDELKNLLYNKAKLGITLGTEYGIGGKGFARMNIASPRPMIMEALGNLKK
ncbi:MAG: PatB family C-S lyase [Flavobacteriaceae bacterium]|nr:PatB family C-S lyase [Flavobacteriaceae bacterium]